VSVEAAFLAGFFDAIFLWLFECDLVDACLVLFLGVVFAVVVVVFVVLAAVWAATAGVAIRAAAATDAINFFIASSCLRPKCAGGGLTRVCRISLLWRQP
jgi:hypothetical protein